MAPPRCPRTHPHPHSRPSGARPTRLAFALSALCALAFLAGSSPARADDLSRLDLGGEWYLLIHYKDDRSEDKEIEKFKDLGWSIQQDATSMHIDEFPYVMFDEGSEEVRRISMRKHRTWEPEGLVLSALRKELVVSPRAMRSKKLRGSFEKGFKSLAPIGGGGALTMNFVRNWSIDFAPERVRIQVIDSLSGGGDMFDEIEDAITFDITGRGPEGELVGTWKDGHKAGSLRMIRSQSRAPFASRRKKAASPGDAPDEP